MIVWLTGPPGVGKSTVGAILAETRGCRFVDVDAEIERTEGRSIAEIFASDGIEKFRSLEHRQIARIGSDPSVNLVAATGGGSVTDSINRDLMRSSGLRIGLTAPPATIHQRVRQGTDRPLLGGTPSLAQIESIIAEREDCYRDVDLLLDASPEPAVVAEDCAERIENREGVEWSLQWSSGEAASQLTALQTPWHAIQAIRRAVEGKRVFLLTDRNLAHHYPETIVQLVGGDGVSYVIEPGEGSKTLTVVEHIAEQMSGHGFERGDVLLSFGGGVVTDLGGLTASLYMRGIESILVPTSLLCMVDATIGGKTAVNVAGVRNLIGTFSPATEIYLVSSFLRTLPRGELRSGLVESLKMGLVASTALQSLVEHAAMFRGFDRYSDLIRESIETKIHLIGEDLLDHGARRILNFGHTIGHALEGLQPGIWRHGDAVAFGMVAETLLGRRHRSDPISESRATALINTILPLTISPSEPLPDADDLLRRVTRDKKATNQRPQFVIPIGENGWAMTAEFEGESIGDAVQAATDLIGEFHEKEGDEKAP